MTKCARPAGRFLTREGDPAHQRQQVVPGDDTAYGVRRGRARRVLPPGGTAARTSAGARLRRGTETGLDALTPAECRTALPAAEGLTNREIADRSYVTRRTVELHLSRVDRKLSVSGRSDLPGVFGASPRLPALRAAS